LIHQIQVTGRHRIKPYFRVPTNSRTPDQGSEVRIVTDWALVIRSRQILHALPLLEATLSSFGKRSART